MTPTDTIVVAGTRVPADHLATVIPYSGGTLWLYGFRAWDGTARFTLVDDHPLLAHPEVLLNGTDWPHAWAVLVKRVEPGSVERHLRSVLPPEPS